MWRAAVLFGPTVSGVTIGYLPDGLVCRITADLASVAAQQTLQDN